VIRIHGRIEIVLVTGDTGARRAGELPVRVTRSASCNRVLPRQRESGVIEPGTAPGRWNVALVTVLDPALGQVIWTRRLRQLVAVAIDALGARAIEIADIGAFVTTEARDSRVTPN